MTPEEEAAIRARDAAVRFVLPDDVPSDAEMHGGIAALDRRTLLAEIDRLRNESRVQFTNQSAMLTEIERLTEQRDTASREVHRLNADDRFEGILRHEYVPGEHHHPMHTDPLCRDCGESKGFEVHR